MQYTKTVHILHDAAQKTVFSHGHTRGSFLSLESSLVEPREEPEYKTSWVINVVAHCLPASNSLFDSTQNGVYSERAGLRSLRRSVHASLSSAVGKNVHFVRKSQSSVQRHKTHKLSDHLCGNCSVCFSPPTFINFSLIVRKDTSLSPLFRTASDEKLGRAWEQGYSAC